MGRPRVLNCPMCGVKKTPENTSLLSRDGGKKYFHRVCRKCDSTLQLKYKWDHMTEEEVMEVRAKYLAFYERVESYLIERRARCAHSLSQ